MGNQLFLAAQLSPLKKKSHRKNYDSSVYVETREDKKGKAGAKKRRMRGLKRLKREKRKTREERHGERERERERDGGRKLNVVRALNLSLITWGLLNQQSP